MSTSLFPPLQTISLCIWEGVALLFIQPVMVFNGQVNNGHHYVSLSNYAAKHLRGFQLFIQLCAPVIVFFDASLGITTCTHITIE